MAKADPYDCLANIDITASRRDRLRRRLDTAQEASHDNITPGLDWVEEMLDNTQRAISLDRFAFMQQAIVAEKAVNFAKTSSRGMGWGILDYQDLVDKTAVREMGWANSKLAEFLNKARFRIGGIVQDKIVTRNWLKELGGESTSDPIAQRAAAIYKEIMESWRIRLNEAGVVIKNLHDWYFPMTHSVTRIRNTDKQVWVDFVMQRLDRKRYRTALDEVMTDEEILEQIVEPSYRNILHDEITRFDRTRGYTRLKYNERILHFKDIESRLEYMDMFAEQDYLAQMVNHLQVMASSTALAEKMGVFPDKTYDQMLAALERVNKQRVVKAGGKKVNPEAGSWAVKQFGDARMKVLTGEANSIENRIIAGGFQSARNVAASSKLGSAFISAWADPAFALMTALINKMPFGRLMMSSAEYVGNSEFRSVMAQTGQVVQAFNSSATGSTRFGDFLGGGMTGRLAQGVIQASGLTNWTDMHRLIFGFEMMGVLGRSINKSYEQLPPVARVQMQKVNISPQEWDLVRKNIRLWTFDAFKDSSKRGYRRDGIFLTPDAVQNLSDHASLLSGGRLPATTKEHAKDLADKFHALIENEKDLATPSPTLGTKALLTYGFKRGTWGGELIRSGTQFMQFPVSVLMQHGARTINLMQEAGYSYGLAYAAGVAVMTTMMGGLAFQAKTLSRGQELKTEFDREFLLASLAQGGGMGVMGDFFYNKLSEHRRSVYTQTLPPTFQIAETIGGLANPQNWDDTFGSRTARAVKEWTPGANLWYARIVMERAFFDTFQAFIDPNWYKTRKKLMENARKRGTPYRDGLEPFSLQ